MSFVRTSGDSLYGHISFPLLLVFGLVLGFFRGRTTLGRGSVGVFGKLLCTVFLWSLDATNILEITV